MPFIVTDQNGDVYYVPNLHPTTSFIPDEVFLKDALHQLMDTAVGSKITEVRIFEVGTERPDLLQKYLPNIPADMED